MICFNVPPCTGRELNYIREAVEAHKICGDGMFTKRCSAWMEEGVEEGRLTESYRYYETTVAKDRRGNVLSRQTGDLNLFHDGVWRLS